MDLEAMPIQGNRSVTCARRILAPLETATRGRAKRLTATTEPPLTPVRHKRQLRPSPEICFISGMSRQNPNIQMMLELVTDPTYSNMVGTMPEVMDWC